MREARLLPGLWLNMAKHPFQEALPALVSWLAGKLVCPIRGHVMLEPDDFVPEYTCSRCWQGFKSLEGVR